MRQCIRFIPAHAGNTPSVLLNVPADRVHPRSRGEYLDQRQDLFLNGGSSPLTRGIRFQTSMFSLANRFIPAHAGNTPEKGKQCLRHQVHPRSRGEYAESLRIFSGNLGSSPLTRGIRSSSIKHYFDNRFIPAHAGNTQQRCLLRSLHGVHPRSRGEYFRTASICGKQRGSSPLTRGILKLHRQIFDCSRFIPAHAGNTKAVCS